MHGQRTSSKPLRIALSDQPCSHMRTRPHRTCRLTPCHLLKGASIRRANGYKDQRPMCGLITITRAQHHLYRIRPKYSHPSRKPHNKALPNHMLKSLVRDIIVPTIRSTRRNPLQQRHHKHGLIKRCPAFRRRQQDRLPSTGRLLMSKSLSRNLNEIDQITTWREHQSEGARTKEMLFLARRHNRTL